MAATPGLRPADRASWPTASRESVEGAPRDVLMLSTDLAAWSWLTLESDLAVGLAPGAVDGQRDRNREPVAAGRFGLRLNF